MRHEHTGRARGPARSHFRQMCVAAAPLFGRWLHDVPDNARRCPLPAIMIKGECQEPIQADTTRQQRLLGVLGRIIYLRDPQDSLAELN